jgi:hypothetical protein
MVGKDDLAFATFLSREIPHSPSLFPLLALFTTLSFANSYVVFLIDVLHSSITLALFVTV